jgi:hypothetical protein
MAIFSDLEVSLNERRKHNGHMRFGRAGVHIRFSGFQYLRPVWKIRYNIERLIMPLKSAVCF